MFLYLFVLAMEYFQRELRMLRLNKDFKYDQRCKKFKVNYICFVDDLLFFCKAYMKSIQLLQGEFQRFSLVSGLKANNEKSSILRIRICHSSTWVLLYHPRN